MNDIGKIAMEALAVGSLSMTLARSRMFREVRWWLARNGRDMTWDLVKCPWCVSHWVAMVTVAVYEPVRMTNSPFLDWMLNWLAVVALAPVAAFLIHRIYGALPPVPTETEWDDPSSETAAESEVVP